LLDFRGQPIAHTSDIHLKIEAEALARRAWTHESKETGPAPPMRKAKKITRKSSAFSCWAKGSSRWEKTATAMVKAASAEAGRVRKPMAMRKPPPSSATTAAQAKNSGEGKPSARTVSTNWPSCRSGSAAARETLA